MKTPSIRKGLRRMRPGLPNPLGKDLSIKGILTVLSRIAGRPGNNPDAGRDPGSRAEEWVGAVLYALLIPFGVEAFRGRTVLSGLTGTLLIAIGLAGVLGLLLRNLGPRAGRRP